MIGRLLLRYKQVFGHGLRVAWNRDIVRKRILTTKPVVTENELCEIHALTSQQDWLNLVWALKSFAWVCPHFYSVCIHDDGTLSDEVVAQLKHHFIGCRIIRRTEANSVAREKLTNHPKCAAFRERHPLSLKLVDTVLATRTNRVLIFDSDLLFFRTPDALNERIDDPDYRKNLFNADFESAYTISPASAKHLFDIELHPCVNSGLGLVHRESLVLDWIEEFLGSEEVTSGHFWWIEQTIFALLSSRFGVELLPPEYTLSLQPGLHKSRPFRHYVGVIRHLMYGEGIPYLVSQGVVE